MTRRDELGEFLRSKRQALHPEDVGLPPGTRRRTPGLRREEVALLAGVSVTWYTWLEQGRRINASRDVLAALCRTLRFDEAARQHVFSLAAGESSEPIETVTEVPDAIIRLITAMEPSPAHVLGPRWEFAAWNSAQARLYPALEDLAENQRNLPWVMFCEPSLRSLILDWESQARAMLAEFRAGTTQFYGDAQLDDLVARVCDASPEFAAWWPQHDVAHFHTRLRRYDHPVAGRLTFEYQQLIPSEWPHLRVVCHLALPDDDSAQRLAKLHG